MTIQNLFRKKNLREAINRNTKDCIAVVTANFKVIMANDLFEDEFCLHPSKICWQSFKRRTSKCDNCPVEQSFQDGKTYRKKSKVVLKNGKTVSMLIESTPIKSDLGKLLYVLVSAQKISEKPPAVQNQHDADIDAAEILSEKPCEMRQFEERYRTIFEHSRDAILLIDHKGKIIDINPAGIELFGYQTKKDILFLSSASQFFENREELIQFQERLLKQSFVLEFGAKLYKKNGLVFDALITSSMITDSSGQNIGQVVIIRDIFKIKQARQHIKTQNARLSALNSVSTAASSSLNLSEMLERTIDKILEILESDSIRIYLLDEKNETIRLVAHKGLSENFISKPEVKERKVGEGLLGQAILSDKARITDNIQRTNDPYANMIVEEGLQTTIYMPLISKEKLMGVICVSIHFAVKVTDDYLEFLTAIGNQIGVAIENANLYNNINDAYQELKKAQEQVIRTEKLASLGKLAATIAHEINNPLAAVLTYIRLMIKMIRRDRFNQDRIEDIQRYLGTMESETARCGEIVKNLLSFSRQSKIKISANSIEEIIERSLTLLAHDLEMNEIRIIKKIDSDLPDVKCDSKQIQQTFLNLMYNASESMQNGGTMTIEANLSERPGYLKVMISDTGCGIPEENFNNIFEPFFTTKDEGKGVGLGLSVVYGIIAKHNGYISVKSEINKWTTFTVLLPTE